MLTRRALLSKVIPGALLSSIAASSAVLWGCSDNGDGDAENDINGIWYAAVYSYDMRLMLEIDDEKWTIYSDLYSMRVEPSGRVKFEGEGYVDMQSDGSYLFTCETQKDLFDEHWIEEALVKLREGKYLVFKEGILYFSDKIRFCRDRSVWYSEFYDFE